MSKAKSISTWVVIVLLAFAFAAAGSGKLMGNEMMHQSFATMGLPAWFGYFIGAAEVAGAIGLLIRKLSTAAASGLFIIMLGAAYYHVVYDALPTVIPALVLAGLTLLVAIVRKRDSLFIGDAAIA